MLTLTEPDTAANKV